MVKERSEIEDRYKWDIESMYSSREESLEELEEIKEDMQELSDYEGEVMGSAENLLEVLRLKTEVSRRLQNVRKFARMRKHEDTRKEEPQKLVSKVEAAKTDFERLTSFVRPEIAESGEKKVEQFKEEEKALQKYEHYFDNLFRMKNHILSSDEEKILSSLGDVNDGAHEIYSAFTNADLKFPEVEKPSGKTVEMSLSNYTKFQKHEDRDFRKKTYEKMFDTFWSYKNTVGTTLNKNIRKNVRYAQIRGFETARKAALEPDNISVSVYDTLVENVNDNLNLLQRFVDLKKEALGVDELGMHDIYMPVAQTESPEVSYEEAKEHVLKALEPLGEEYVKKVRKGLEDESWIDVYDNRGKKSGAYSGGSYDSRPFILMNYQNDIDSMFTLAHELGHSMHSHYTTSNQPYIYSNYTIFQAEVASTTNEALLTRHLLNTVEDEEFRRHVLSHALENFKSTLFRQTLFSEFEQWLHTEVENGEALTPNKLSDRYRNLKQKYYSNAEIDERIGREWMRIPHFYYNFYVFQYATGISAGNMLAEKIISEGPEDYKEFLKTGGSEYSIESLKKAGADLSTTEPIEAAMQKFEQHLEKLENLD
jgi:oligoendopeptidase F